MTRLICMCAIASGFVAAGQSTTQQQNQVQMGSLTGSVIDSVTHQPIKKARVQAFCATQSAASPNGMQNHAVSTDANGAFLFDNNLPPGSCFVTATTQDYPQAGGMVRPQPVNITPSDKNGPVTIELTPPASVSGRIVDEDGDPLIGCFAQAHPAAQPQQSIGIGNDNSSGEFRISHLPAARYYISARCNGNVFEPRPFSSGPDPPPSRAYPQQFYPLAPDAKSAQVVTLAPGMEKPGIDFQLKPAAVTQVRVALTLGGAPIAEGQNYNVQLMAVEPADTSFNGPTRNTQKGTFEFRQVFPGSYYLAAFLPGQTNHGASALERIEVKDRPIEMVLELKPGVSLNGVMTLDDSSKASTIQLNHMRVQFVTDNFMSPGRNPGAAVNADGTFTLADVPPWRWRVMVNGPNVYLKSAFLGPTDVTHDAFDFPSASGDLRIVLGTNMGTISGTAPAGAMLWASNGDPRFGGMRAAQVDAAGHFTMQQVAPGTYRVGSAPPGSAGFDESSGVEVVVKEGQTVTVDIKP